LKTLKAIKSATVEELKLTGGIPYKTAENIYKFYHTEE